jgi:hypothetical protein
VIDRPEWKLFKGNQRMTIRTLPTPSVTVAAGMLLFSCAAFAEAQSPAQPRARQPQMVASQGQSAPGGEGRGQAPQRQQPQANTQPMAPIADVVLSFSATETQPAQVVALASDVDMIPITLYTTSTNGTDGEFMHAMSAVCSGSAFLRNDANTIEATGFCNYGDADGNQVFEHFVIPPQSRDHPLQAAGHWTGGTGKYHDLQGDFVLTGIVLPTIGDGIIQVAGQKHGQYTIEGKDETQVPAENRAPPAADQSPASRGQPR